MKYLLVFALVIVVLWLWRASRKESTDDRDPQSPIGGHASPSSNRQLDPHQPVTEIVACDVCHVHLPRTEALTGPDGVYCSVVHQRQAGR